MTIDEVIAEEKKNIALNKAKYEFECRYYGKDTVERGSKLDCVKEYEYHMQIVELLDELKKRRNADEGYLADIYQDIGYKNGVDDFKMNWDSRVKDLVSWCKDTRLIGLQQADSIFDEIAKQLKAGGENE